MNMAHRQLPNISEQLAAMRQHQQANSACLVTDHYTRPFLSHPALTQIQPQITLITSIPNGAPCIARLAKVFVLVLNAP